MGGLSNQFSLHHPESRPRKPDRHHPDVLLWLNSLKEIHCRDSQNRTRVQNDDRGRFFGLRAEQSRACTRHWGAIHSVPPRKCWTATFSGHPCRYGQTLNCPPANQPIVLPGLPMVITQKCVHRHNRITIACFMFVVSMGTTLGSLTDLQQLPQTGGMQPAPVKHRRR